MKNKGIMWYLTIVSMMLLWTFSIAGTARLESFVVNKHRFSTQFIFDFSDVPICRSRAVATKQLFELEFLDTEKGGFHAQSVVKKLSTLPQVNDVTLSFQDDPKHIVRISIKMDPSETSVRVNSYKELKQVVLDIYSKKTLEKLVEQKSHFLEVASATSIKFFATSSVHPIDSVRMEECFAQDELGRDRVVLVANDSMVQPRKGRCGAGRSFRRNQFCEVLEKTQYALRQEGFHPFYLRDQHDENIADHAKFAQQVGARLLVKMDVNNQSSGLLISSIMTCGKSNPSDTVVLKWPMAGRFEEKFAVSTAQQIVRKAVEVRKAEQEKLSLSCIDLALRTGNLLMC